MFRKSLFAQSLIVYLVVMSMIFVPVPARANDIVPSDDLAGGASVFVFRGSSKKPQGGGAAAMGSRAGFGSTRSGKARMASQIATARKKKADAKKARAAEIARARARERVAKLKQSNTFAAKGETQMDAGAFNSAITSFRESIKLNAKNAEAINGLSEALTAKGISAAGDSNDEAGMPFLTEAVKLDAKNEAAYAKIGEIHDAKGRNTEAIANYEKAYAINPELTSVLLPLGLAHAEAKNYVEAEAFLAKAEASGLASSEARLARADIMMKQGRSQEAIAMIDRVIASEPSNAAALFAKASALDAAGQKDQALAGYQNVVRMDPNYSAAWLELGIAAYNKGDYNGAVNSYQNVVRIEPTNYEAQANLASSFRQLERYPEANAAYKAAEPGNTKNPDHYSEWGFCLGKTNEWDKAVARLLTARELSPSAVDNTNLGWAYYNAARVDQKNGDEAAAKAKYELARTYLNTATQQDPNLDAAYMNLGSTSNALGDHQAAADALNTAVKLHPNWVIAMNQLGLSYRGLNNLVAAIDLFKRVTALDSRNVFGMYNLGEVYHLTGNKKEAKKVQDSLKELDRAFATKLDHMLSATALAESFKHQ